MEKQHSALKCQFFLTAIACMLFVFAQMLNIDWAHAETPLASTDTIVIRKTLDTLYNSFSFAAGKDPNWKIMHSMALPGATFVPAPQPGTKRSGVGIDKFINDYKTYVKSSPLRVTGYYEHMVSVRINRVNTVATATVVFRASVPGEKRKRKPGMDNIQLLLNNGSWKIVAFTTQSESDTG